MSLWSHVVYHFVLILLINYTSVTHQSDYININTVFYLGETNVEKKKSSALLLCHCAACICGKAGTPL